MTENAVSIRNNLPQKQRRTALGRQRHGCTGVADRKRGGTRTRLCTDWLDRTEALAV